MTIKTNREETSNSKNNFSLREGESNILIFFKKNEFSFLLKDVQKCETTLK